MRFFEMRMKTIGPNKHRTQAFQVNLLNNFENMFCALFSCLHFVVPGYKRGEERKKKKVRDET